jgi:hypothetical protein
MCPLGFLMLGSTLQDLPNDSPAACRPACRRRQASLRTRLPTDERSSRAPGLSWSATRSSWPLPNHLPRRQPSSNRRLGWPSTACAGFETRRRLRQTTSRSWTQRATTPTRPSQPYGCLPTAALQDLTSAGHSARGNAQTPDADTGRPDSGHLDAQTPALDTGHRTLAEDVDRVTTARPASGPPAPPRRATARWTPNRVPVDSPCRLGGEAAFQREIASRRQLLGRSAGVERRLGALLSSDEFRVERRANGDASSVMASRLAGLLLVVTYGRAARL